METRDRLRASWEKHEAFGSRSARLACLAMAMMACLLVTIGRADDPPMGASDSAVAKREDARDFDSLLAKYRDLEYPELREKMCQPRRYLDRPSFDPTRAEFFPLVKRHFEMTPGEIELFKKNGFISLDPKLRHTFASAYQQIYAADLPVLVTTDSILHALHVSYDQLLLELEADWFSETLRDVLEECHERVVERGRANDDPVLALSYRDVDLYLSVGRSLLAGAGAPATDPTSTGPVYAFGRYDAAKDEWIGGVPAPSGLGQDGEAEARLRDIQSLIMQVPGRTPATSIYGGTRYVDYSQFAPRGHYTASTPLRRYFRCAMWLGRADCGWNVLPADNPALKIDDSRELRDAALLAELLRETGNLARFKAMDDALTFLVGRGDNLTAFDLLDVLQQQKVASFADLRDAGTLGRLREAIRAGDRSHQRIRAQVLLPASADPEAKAMPPGLFQLLGQRFVIDSFVLSQVVHDAIVFKGQRMMRMMPTGLDVMAALGNDEAIPLLESELTRWKYGANLAACREFVERQPQGTWKESLYNVWLSALRTLDDDVMGVKNMPEALRTRAWQHKQLQAQLGSWAELRHDTILYAKQSYSVPLCGYPAGFVEPYPDFFATLESFAQQAGALLAAARPAGRDADPSRRKWLEQTQQRQVAFFAGMARIIGQLGVLAQKERDGEPFDAAEKDFLKAIVSARGAGSGPPRYDGWYAGLFYIAVAASRWNPTIADVHTDVQNAQALEVGVGDANFGILAIDHRGECVAYVGPLYSYYEFRQPVGERLTDEAWHQRIMNGSLPARPPWTQSFQAPPRALSRIPLAPGGKPFNLPERGSP